MAYTIAPLSFGGILDQSFRLLRDQLLPLCLPMVLAYLPYTLIAGLMAPDPTTQTVDPAALLAFVPSLIYLGIAFPYAQLVVVKNLTALYHDRPITVRDAMTAIRGSYWPYVGTCMLFGLGMLPGLLCCGIPAVYLATLWALIGPIAVVEHRFGPDALGRSRDLVRGAWFRVLGLELVSGLLAWVFSAAAGLTTGWIPVLGHVLGAVVQGAASSYTSAVLVVAYTDQRARREGFDLELQAQRVAADAPGAEHMNHPG